MNIVSDDKKLTQMRKIKLLEAHYGRLKQKNPVLIVYLSHMIELIYAAAD